MRARRARWSGSVASSARRKTDTLSSELRDHGLCLFGPRVRLPDDPIDRSYATLLTMTIQRLTILASISKRRLACLLERMPVEQARGRPWSCPLRHLVLIACAALRTNLTVRELAAVFQISKSAA